jgi:hypothetical protein
MKSTVADQIFDATPFWFWLKDKGKMRTVEGGRFLTEPLQYDKSDNVKWTGKGGQMPMNDQQFLTIAKYDWRYLAGSIVRFGVDDQQNRGKNEIINFMNSKMENLRNALISEMETRLSGASGAVSAGTTTAEFPAFDGLQILVKDDPTTSTEVGGINQSTDTWWRNKTTNMSGESFATFGVTRMRTMLNNTMNNLKMDMPDIIVTGQTPYEFYEDNVLQYYRTQNNKLGDMGFQNIVFKGIPMVWTPSISGRIYFLNTNFISFVYDPMMFFDLTEWKAIPNQINDRTAQIVTACAMTVSRRRCQGVIYNVTTQ